MKFHWQVLNSAISLRVWRLFHVQLVELYVAPLWAADSGDGPLPFSDPSAAESTLVVFEASSVYLRYGGSSWGSTSVICAGRKRCLPCCSPPRRAFPVQEE